MNARAETTLAVLAIASLVPSSTHIQEMRRARFDKKALQELADSIKQVGVLQPPVARPKGEKYELVAGERRFLAAKLAGLKEIACSVRELTDEQVLEVQLVENLQREGLHELEEAEGYEELMKLKKLRADDLVDMLGKSRSYIYARIKLFALCPEARKAFYAGELDASRALLVARIGHHDTQRQAMKDILDRNEPMSFRNAREHIQRRYMLLLKSAPFDIKDASLLPKAGTCEACPKRTGNQRDLFADVKNADVCTDPKCFADKRAAHGAAAVKKLEAQGKKVVAGADAKKIFPNADSEHEFYRERTAGGYVKLSDDTWVSGTNKKVADVLGKDFEPLLVQHPNGQIIKMATQAALTAAVNKGRKVKSGASKSRPAHRPAAGKGNGDFELREKAARAIAAQLITKHPGTIGRAELLYLVNQEHEAWDATDESLYTAFKLPAHGRGSLAKLSDKDLVRFFIAGAVTDGLLGGFGNTPGFAAAMCKRFKLDFKKVQKELAAEGKLNAGSEKTRELYAKSKPLAGPVTSSIALIPSPQLATIVGDQPLTRPQVTVKMAAYIKKHKLSGKGATVTADEALRPIFGKGRIALLAQVRAVNKHLRIPPGATTAQAKGDAWPFPVGSKPPIGAKLKKLAKKHPAKKQKAKK